jgi:predicted RNA-binding protein YlqC (UPF0109 family)
VSIDQQFVEFVVKSLVSKPDEVKVERRIDEKGVLLELTVDPEDLGRVIGKRGATAQSIRTLLRALGTKNDARYNLKIVDNGPERPGGSGSGSGSKSGGLWGDDEDSSSSSSDSGASANTEAEEVVSEAASDVAEEPEAPEEQNDESEEDSFARTRKELADLDDLDV